MTDIVGTTVGAPGGTRVVLVDGAGWAGGAADWLRCHEPVWTEALGTAGAVLLRGFGDVRPADVVAVTERVFRRPYRTTEHPREVVPGRLVAPVAYPPGEELYWHNEDSFNFVWPGRIVFACATPAATGGETTLVDGVEVWRRLPLAARRAFAEVGVRYVRRYIPGLGLSWSDVYRTDDPAEVERISRREGVDLEWVDDALVTTAVRPAVLRDHTGETAWFAQILHWHGRCLDETDRAGLLELLDGVLPRECSYGDGTPIPDEVVDELIAISRALEHPVRWTSGDVLLINNRRMAHGRRPFSGERDIMAAFGDPGRF